MTIHEQSVVIALEANVSLGKMFDNVGNLYETGPVTDLYSLIRKLLKGNIKKPAEVKEAFQRLRSGLEAYIVPWFFDAQTIGIIQTQKYLSLYGSKRKVNSVAIPGEAISSVISLVDHQEHLLNAMIDTGDADESLLLGSIYWGLVLNPKNVLTSIKNWIATITGSQLSIGILDSNLPLEEFGYQAIAIIDKKTTRTCLNVHGQVQPIDVPFELEGEPKYNDFMLKPPFHDFCRTSRALVELASVDGDFTNSLVTAAMAELDNRKKK